MAAAIACALTLGVSLGQPTPQLPSAADGNPVKRFRFDGGFRQEGGLRFVFNRAVPTVDPSGQAVSPMTARYASKASLAGAPTFELVRQTTHPMVGLASGLDSDGVTPLMVTLESQPTQGLLDVFIGAGDDLLAAEQTGIGRIRTILPTSGDVMRGTIPGKQYRINSGVVCHGLIVLFCTVSAWDAPSASWLDSASAFVTSQNHGQTWGVAFESAPFFPGSRRGAPWAMQNWWPTTRNAAPTEAYFAAADYCFNPGAPGGQFYIMRARRATPGDPWSIEPGAVALASANGNGEHFHTGAVLPLAGGGIRALLAIGDGRRNNRIVSLISPDADYTSGNWIINQSYHGAHGVLGIEGNQFVGCAPGPFPDSVLVGSDLSAEQVMLLSTGDAAATSPLTTHLYGFSPSDGTGPTVFSIRSPTPERGGPYCVNAEPFSQVTLTLVRRVLYSPDGLNWAQAASPAGGYPLIHGDHIYFDAAPGRGMERIPVPKVISGRPLLIGPGGMQHERAEPLLEAGAAPRMVVLSRDALGRWVDNGVPLDPQPPTMGPVFRLTTSSKETVPWIGRIFPAGPDNRLNRILGFQTMVRVWLHQADPTRSATLSLGFGDSVTAPQFYRSAIVQSVDSWIPISVAGHVELAPNSTLQLYARSSGPEPDDQTIYLALDSVQEGRGVPGYPMPPDPSVPAIGTAHPDELARISGLSCSDKQWTITLLMQLPEDGFDFRSPLQSRWPIATLWGDADNYIELIADTTQSQLQARLTVNGRTGQVLRGPRTTFVRGAPILVSIAQPDGAGSIEMTLSAAGHGLHTTAIPLGSAARLGVGPREIRFYSAQPTPSAMGIGVPVSPLTVWAGQVDERSALSRETRERMLSAFSFLARPFR